MYANILFSIFLQPHVERVQLQESGSKTQASTGSGTQSVPEVPISAPNPDLVSFRAEYCLNSNSGNGTKHLGNIRVHYSFHTFPDKGWNSGSIFIFLLHAIVKQPGSILIHATSYFLYSFSHTWKGRNLKSQVTRLKLPLDREHKVYLKFRFLHQILTWSVSER